LAMFLSRGAFLSHRLARRIQHCGPQSGKQARSGTGAIF
jgi:hypothetical protein